jgi:hypothetical protein
VDCVDSAPDNATSEITEVTVNWKVEEGKWEEPIDCTWTCNTDYLKIEDGTGCIHKDQVDICADVTCGDNETCFEGECNCNTGYKLTI